MKKIALPKGEWVRLTLSTSYEYGSKCRTVGHYGIKCRTVGHYGNVHPDMYGRIMGSYSGESDVVAVEFPDIDFGHSCHDQCEHQHGYYVPINVLEVWVE